MSSKNFVTQGQYPDNRQETTLTAPDRVAAQIAHPQTVVRANDLLHIYITEVLS